ncbi:septal ring lytic transglycosylase RlpA family protein [Marinobacter persicus]|uniref:Endolytic peptidoglycan transglycosylase RlpA n=1 Tax=Marinobacter persicus TaxID=930118 RepID=A0A2S6G7Y9_9GAMM|nr:septal ring lytic transglycosylase RlpA family protein [Marinobacter persicus]PPK52329.1 rare lipoprotein A [Marinobacter persicus]PPK55305.1 rare lipoprotein A [Marinobacter persicus]PPK59072.1 rare lipoprotein A [Marinobacter persicus]
MAKQWGALLLAVMTLAGCASSPETDHSARYTLKQDRAPAGGFDASGLADAVPRYQAPQTAGNKSPYTVWGKSYRVLDSNDGYVARGIASWYGEKFHGHKTSNGEVFDMYAMSAAHKSLRIPGYAKVTNLDNGRSVIVRVNDRGPFHANRLIDLSYAAAKKLGYHDHGTARVEVAAITVRPDGTMYLAGEPWEPASESAVTPPLNAGMETGEGEQVQSSDEMLSGEALFVQLGAFSNRDPARALLARAQNLVDSPIRVREVSTERGRFHRVQVGPFPNESEARYAQTLLESLGFGQTIVLTDSH